MKMVINVCYGGFGLSDKACEILGIEGDWDISRDDPRLVALVEDIGQEAAGHFAELQVVTIPDEATDFTVDEYDGYESVIYVLNGKLKWV